MFPRASFCGLENDVFISYAHADNSEGWVDEFHERLLNRLRELERHAPFSIWRDRKLSGADVFTDEIEWRLKSSGILISILSPNGLGSDWCERERERFRLAAATSGGLRLGTKTRAIRIAKSPCDNNRDRLVFGTLGYDFYKRSDQTNRYSELHPTSSEFSALVLEIAQEIYDLLKTLRERLAAAPPDLSIYVAAVPPALQPWRKQVVNQLAAWNCRVVPEESDARRLSAADIEQSLQGCNISVHWVGSDAGPELEMLQLRAAREASLERIVCEVKESSAALQELLGAKPAEGYEERMRSGTPDILLQYLEDRVKAFRKTPARASGDPPLVYVVCNPVEMNAALELKRCLEADGRFAARLPIRDVEDENLRLRDKREWLKSCQAVLIYWGASASEAWFGEQQRELIGARLKRRKRPLPALCLASSPKADPAKDSLPGLPVQQISDVDCSSVRRHFRWLDGVGA
jgi:TIR domain